MRVKIIRISFLLILFFNAFALYSQQISGNKGAPPVRERIFFGGNFGLQIGTYTYIEVSPLIGYWLLPRVAVAAGPSFKYIKDPFGDTDVWGGKSFIRLVIINDVSRFIPIGLQTSFYLHSEYEVLSYRSDFFSYSYDNERVYVETALAGVGISQKIGKRGAVNFSILWVLNDSGYQIYDNPEFRIGFNF